MLLNEVPLMLGLKVQAPFNGKLKLLPGMPQYLYRLGVSGPFRAASDRFNGCR